MSSSVSVAARAALSVGLMAGFYLPALAISAGLVYLPVAELLHAQRIT